MPSLQGKLKTRNGNKVSLYWKKNTRLNKHWDEISTDEPQLFQWDRSNPSYLVDAPFALLMCGLNTNSTQGFLNLGKNIEPDLLVTVNKIESNNFC